MGDELDPRIAATGGMRAPYGGTGYIWPGMMDEANWRKTNVHKFTRQYSCAHCGQGFNSPAAVYTHMAKRHGK